MIIPAKVGIEPCRFARECVSFMHTWMYLPSWSCVYMIEHWLKNFMKETGIDASTFTAHSTWGAATSKVKAVGVPMADIIKAGN